MGVGYLKLYRKTLDNPTVMKDADHLAIWIWLLMNAKFFPTDDWFGGERITLQPGQFISEHMIEQRTDRQGRLITIVSWDEYQASEQFSEQRVNNDRTTSEQRVNTITKRKEGKNIKNHHSNTATADEKWGRYLIDSLLGDA